MGQQMISLTTRSRPKKRRAVGPVAAWTRPDAKTAVDSHRFESLRRGAGILESRLAFTVTLTGGVASRPPTPTLMGFAEVPECSLMVIRVLHQR